MKELSIEEKATRYDEALVRANEMIKDMTNIGGVAKVDDIQYIFPELKESKDEKIRACIRMCLTDIDEQRFADFNTNLKECRDWLEKQGEHAKFRDSIQVGDKVTRNEDGVLVNLSQLNRVAKKDEKKGEQKLTEFERAVKQVMEEAIECGDTHNLKADAEMLLSLVHKSAWSEEDEKLLDKVIKRLHKYSAEDEEYLDKYYWLIELKHRVQPQNTWKPSDEQMATLEYYMHILVCNSYKEMLFGLYQDLKKLREE